MNELIKINFENNRPTVLGRELHEALQVKTPYSQWFERVAEYGFTENIDFMTVHKDVIRADFNPLKIERVQRNSVPIWD